MTMPGAPAPQLDIIGAGTRLLDVVSGQLVAQGVELPSIVCLTPGGNVAYDGDQLTATLTAIEMGQPNKAVTAAVLPTQFIQAFTWELNLLRVVQTIGEGINIQLPTPAGMTDDYVAIAADAQALWAALVTIAVTGIITPVGIPFQFGPLRPVGPEGGLAGSRVTVSHQAYATASNPNPGQFP